LGACFCLCDADSDSLKTEQLRCMCCRHPHSNKQLWHSSFCLYVRPHILASHFLHPLPFRPLTNAVSYRVVKFSQQAKADRDAADREAATGASISPCWMTLLANVDSTPPGSGGPPVVSWAIRYSAKGDRISPFDCLQAPLQSQLAPLCLAGNSLRGRERLFGLLHH